MVWRYMRLARYRWDETLEGPRRFEETSWEWRMKIPSGMLEQTSAFSYVDLRSAVRHGQAVYIRRSRDFG